jgi:flagellar hook-basal body complex protein FliE
MAIAALGSISSVTRLPSVAGAGSLASSGAAAVDPTAPGAAGAASTSGPGGGLVNSFADAFSQLNTQLTGADAAVSNFAAGGSSDLHTVMLQMQEASISLKVGVQVRDQLLAAYQELMRIQL